MKIGDSGLRVGNDDTFEDNAKRFEEPLGWYSRGYLPHADFPGLLQSVTYRLSDSLPRKALAEMERELALVDPEEVPVVRRKTIEALLDAGHGSCLLRDSRVAACVIENWRRFAGQRYDLIAWVVMPNHVHVLIRVYDGMALGKIVQSWKSYTARRIVQWIPDMDCLGRGNQLGSAERQLGRSQDKVAKGRAGARRSRGEPFAAHHPPRVWLRDYWDRYIRDERHFAATVDYIHQNPVKAGLADQAEDWPWSSASEWGSESTS